jgi:hypothetical protein
MAGHVENLAGDEQYSETIRIAPRARPAAAPCTGGGEWCKARQCPHYAPIRARDQQCKLSCNLGES